MNDYLVFDSDDFGCNHIISDQCQSHDCRDVLLKLKEVNPRFKATLFAIPDEMTLELLEWSKKNGDWIELSQHGFNHSSNHECDKMSYDDFDVWMTEQPRAYLLDKYFSVGFKSPGWQTSDSVFRWLRDHNFWIADQPYNKNRRPKDLKVYEVGAESLHTHTWNCVGNGVYELYDMLEARIAGEKEFKLISELFDE